MANWLKKKITNKVDKIEIFYIPFTILSSLIFIFLIKFSLEIFSGKDGFVGASPQSNNKVLCRTGLETLDCEKKILSSKNTILFLGNSQLGAINNYSKGEITYPEILSSNEYFKEKKIKIKSIWLPNVNIVEYEFILSNLKKCGFEPSKLFLPLIFDDFSDHNIREEVQPYASELCNINYTKELNNKDNNQNISAGNVKNLSKKIKNYFQVFEELNQINIDLKLFIYKIRNFAFNIDSSTKRKLNKISYEKNIEKLKLILEERQSPKFKNYFYIAPVLNANSNLPFPYYIDEYNSFKKRIEEICRSQNCIFKNLENLIPSNEWGGDQNISFKRKKTNLDFMHFKYEGHKRLSSYFNSLLIKN